jgi:hypothetical protein
MRSTIGTRRLIATATIIAGLLVSATPADASSGPAKPLPKVLKAAEKRAKGSSVTQRQVKRGSLALRSTSSTWKYLGHTGGHRVGNALVGSIAHYWTGKSNGYSYVVQKDYYCDLMRCTHESSYWAVYQQGQWWGWYQYCTPYNSVCIPAEFPIS